MIGNITSRWNMGRGAARRRVGAAAGLAAVLLLTACGGGDLAGPAAAGDPVAGKEAYDANCASCHGPGGTGTTKGPPFLDRVYEPSHHGDAAFLIAVRSGSPAHHWDFGDMPPVPGVTDAQVTDIVAYVRGLQRAAGIN